MFFRRMLIAVLPVTIILSIVACTDSGSKSPTETNGDSLTGHEYTWSFDTLSAPNTSQIRMESIWGANTDDIWAVGHSDISSHQVWRRVHNKWVDQKVFFSGINFTPAGIYGFSPEDIWCVGVQIKAFSEERTSFIAHYNGTKWQLVTDVSTVSCWSVWGTSSSNLFVSCDSGRIVRFDGSTWSEYQTDTPRSHILSVTGSSVSNVYAAGINSGFVQPIDTNFHHFYRYEDSQWITVQTFTENIGLSTLPFGLFLWMDENENLYSAGLGGIYQFTSETWIRVAEYTSLRSIGGSDSENLFVGGFDHQLHHFNGKDWFTYTNFDDQSQYIRTIWATTGGVHLSSYNGYRTIMIYGERVVE